jgi:hypothetical protein
MATGGERVLEAATRAAAISGLDIEIGGESLHIRRHPSITLSKRLRARTGLQEKAAQWMGGFGGEVI